MPLKIHVWKFSQSFWHIEHQLLYCLHIFVKKFSWATLFTWWKHNFKKQVTFWKSKERKSLNVASNFESHQQDSHQSSLFRASLPLDNIPLSLISKEFLRCFFPYILFKWTEKCLSCHYCNLKNSIGSEKPPNSFWKGKWNMLTNKNKPQYQ